MPQTAHSLLNLSDGIAMGTALPLVVFAPLPPPILLPPPVLLPRRYFMWLHATPAMLYTLSLMSGFSRRRVGRLLAVDVVMIGSAILGELSGGECIETQSIALQCP